MKLPFYKMTRSGNDFIIIDNRQKIVDSNNCKTLVRAACRRKYSVGADGLILIENDSQVDFKWRFFNADGSEAEMCGNGGRCAARFAVLNNIVKEYKMAFRTIAGVIHAETSGERVKLEMTSPSDLELNLSLSLKNGPLQVNFINTGVPHTVVFVGDSDELSEYDVFSVGRKLRYDERFQPSGTNANFVAVSGDHEIEIRTYERGVEDETLACGTGSIASAILSAVKKSVVPPVRVTTRSGEILTVHFTRDGNNFTNVFLEGDAKVVYEGTLWQETL